MRLTVQYNGSVANAAYGSCAGNYTNSASNMGWGDYAYLVDVYKRQEETLSKMGEWL